MSEKAFNHGEKKISTTLRHFDQPRMSFIIGRILRFLETSRRMMWGKLIILRCHTFLESVWLHSLHPRESPCIFCFGSWWPCMFFQQQNNITSFVFQKKAKRLSTPIIE